MALWRRKAIEQFPELRSILTQKGMTIYDLFSELQTLLAGAVRERDDAVIRRIFRFAEWCRNHEAKNLWNPAGVAFYEHLFDNWQDREAVLPWLSPGAIRDPLPLWQLMLGAEKFQDLQRLLREPRQERWRECTEGKGTF